MTSAREDRKPLPKAALGAVVVGWLLFAAFASLMTYAAWTDDGLDWYLAVGPTVGAVIVVFGAVAGLPLILREQRRLRRSRSE